MRRRPTQPTRPAGFTLIELLVVIVILGLLVGLIVPAVMNAVNTAKNATASAEIQALSQALAAFKNAYGEFPPSRILVSENGDYSTATIPANLQVLGRRSVQYFKKFWPRMIFNTGSTANPAGAGGNPSGIGITGGLLGFYDVDGNGSMATAGTYYILQGPECLVFFLGGLPQTVGTNGWAMTGFAKNPANPFMNATAVTNRQAPFYDFPGNRLVSNLTNAGGPAGGFPGFLDSLGSYDPNDGAIPFYVYFSSYGGVGYDPGDCDMDERDDSNPARPKLMGGFTATNAAASQGGGVVYQGGIISQAPNPYTNGPPLATLATGNVNDGAFGTIPRARVWQNAQSYQILCAGRDRVFGMGGQYNPSGAQRLPFVDAQNTPGYVADSLQTMQANAQMIGVGLSGDVRAREADNLTNFSQGKLD